MIGNNQKEFGDYQTPLNFCNEVCSYIKDIINPSIIIEPTCGRGNFLKSVNKVFESELIGIDINATYVEEARKNIPNANIYNGDIFSISTNKLHNMNDILVIGNPPWAVNSNLSYNLPIKSNFKGLKGLNAVTGASNFDICEYIILKMINEYIGKNTLICMLCKKSVARNVILEIKRNNISCEFIEMLNFDAMSVFSVAVSSCVLVIKMTTKNINNYTIVEKDFKTQKIVNNYAINGNILTSVNSSVINLEGTCQLKWRQGIKHDCANVMELEKKSNYYINKKNEVVDIEEDLVYPLIKSSGFKNPIIKDFQKYVIVTQHKIGEDTTYIKDKFPKSWEYLNFHKASFDNRKSSIYKNAPQFAMFGVGDYSFLPYKVGISGFYKNPLFCLLLGNKAIMTDDTSYFLSFYDYNIAYCMMLLLNSNPVQNFLKSIAFLDNKRPWTIKVLSRLDLVKAIDNVPFEEMLRLEKSLELSRFIDKDMYIEFKFYLKFG